MWYTLYTDESKSIRLCFIIDPFKNTEMTTATCDNISAKKRRINPLGSAFTVYLIELVIPLVSYLCAYERGPK